MSNPAFSEFAGSLRRGSYNRAALRAAMQLVPQDAALEIFALDGIPGFQSGRRAEPAGQSRWFKQHVRNADAILIVTPEYNYSVPGVLKNARWASRPYGDRPRNRKPVAIMALRLERLAPRGRNINFAKCSFS